MHDNIKPFLRPAIPKTDTDLENDMEFSNAFADKIAPSYLSDLYKAPFNQSLTLSDEELANLREACVSDSTRVIHYLDSVLKDKQDLMERQVKSLEHIAEQAYTQASSAHALSEIARKHSDTAAHQVNVLKERLKIQKEQLEFAKSEAASAKKEALFAKVTSVIAILISIAAIIVPIVTG